MTKKESDEIKVTVEDDEEPKKAPKKKKKAEETSVEEKEQEYLDQLQRLQAEFQNYKRRVEKDWKEVTLIAKADLSLKFISIIDDLERVVAHHECDDEIPSEGVRLILQKCQKLLSDEGVEEIRAVGEHFDPELHAAITVENVDEEDKDDTVLEEWQKGYTFGERLLRPSQVKVGRYNPEDGE